MGCLDTVIATCPLCGSEVEFHSKAGTRQAEKHSQHFVPTEIALDIHGNTSMCRCGAVLAIVYTGPRLVPVSVIATRESVGG